MPLSGILSEGRKYLKFGFIRAAKLKKDPYNLHR